MPPPRSTPQLCQRDRRYLGIGARDGSCWQARPEESGALPALSGSGLAGRNPSVALPAFCDTRGPSGFPLSHLLSHAREASNPQLVRAHALRLSHCRTVALRQCEQVDLTQGCAEARRAPSPLPGAHRALVLRYVSKWWQAR